MNNQTIAQRRKLKGYKLPEEIVNDTLRRRAWEMKGSDFSFTRSLLVLATIGIGSLAPVFPPFDWFPAFVRTGVVQNWWAVVCHALLFAASFGVFMFLNGKIDAIVRKRVEDTAEALRREYWEGISTRYGQVTTNERQ